MKKRIRTGSFILALVLTAGMLAGNGSQLEVQAAQSDAGKMIVTAEAGDSTSVVRGTSTEELKKEDVILDGILQQGDFLKEPSIQSQTQNGVQTFATGTYQISNDAVIAEQIQNGATNIDVSGMGITTNNIQDIIRRVYNNFPRAMWTSENCGYYLAANGTDVTRLAFSYTLSTAEMQRRQTQVDEAVEAALSQVDDSMTDVEKALVLHDYIITNCEYSYERFQADKLQDDDYNMYGTLVERQAVCQGYAETYMYLLRSLGMTCAIVTSESLSHAWNAVLLDGKWYYVDTTWDDPVWDLTGRCEHTNFLQSAESFQIEYTASDYLVLNEDGYLSITATDKQYEDDFWTTTDTAVYYEQDNFYYINNVDGTLRKIQYPDETTGTVIKTIAEKWLAWDNNAYYCIYNFSKLALYHGILYYSTPTVVYGIDLSDAAAENTPYLTIDPQKEQGYIYGMSIQNGQFSYSIHQKMQLSEKETILTAAIPVVKSDPEIKTDLKLSEGTITFTESPYSSSASCDYDNTAKEPKVAVYDKNNELVDPNAYTVSYRNNIDPGTAAVVVTAKEGSGYTGSNVKTFEITYTVAVPIMSVIENDVQGIYLSWNTVAEGKEYDVYGREGNSGAWIYLATYMPNSAEQKSCSAIIFESDALGMTSGKTYSFTVAAVTTVGTSIVSSAYGSSTLGIVYLKTPKLTKLENTAAGPKLTYTAVAGASGYDIYRSLPTDEDWTLCDSVSAGTLSVTDKTAKSGQTYAYMVCAYRTGATGAADIESGYDADGLSIKYLSQPVLNTAANTVAGIQIKWSKVPGCSGYLLQRKAAGGSWSTIKNITSASTVSYQDTTASAGKTYSYRLYASSGSAKSAASAEKSVRRLKQTTVTITPAASGNTVKWKKVSGASGYYVYRKAGSATTWKQVKKVSASTTSSWKDTSVSNGKKYTYTVCAYAGSVKAVSASGKIQYRLNRPSISSLSTEKGKLTIKYSKNTAASGYQIQWSLSSSFKSVKSKTIASKSTIKYTVKSLKVGKKYYVRMRSYKKVSGKTYYSAWSSTKSQKIAKK